jgi:hypothetical protein
LDSGFGGAVSRFTGCLGLVFLVSSGFAGGFREDLVFAGGFGTSDLALACYDFETDVTRYTPLGFVVECELGFTDCCGVTGCFSGSGVSSGGGGSATSSATSGVSGTSASTIV